jgi:exopolysaccharide production protein ExoZ
MEKLPARKYDGLQVLRFLAALLVVVFHATSISSEQLGGPGIWANGAYGVDIFFVLSGFVIVWSSAKLGHTRDGWLIFLERRVVRVVPMYWIGTTFKVIAMVVASSMVVHARLSVPSVLASYFFIPSRNLDNRFMPVLGVGWTLNYEMFFYALFAIALLIRTNVFRFVGVILALLAIGAYFRRPWWPAPSFYLDTIVLDFFLGMMIAKLCLQNRRLPRAVSIPMLVAGVILLCLPVPSDTFPRVVASGIPAAMVVWATASLEGFLPRIPAVILFLADASYSIYLFHLLAAQLPAVMMARYHIDLPWTAVSLSIAISLAVGSVFHQFLERPITNWFRENLRNRHQTVIHQA